MTDYSGWAKAHTFTDPAAQSALRAQTRADRYLYTEASLSPVQCERCAAEVLVRKTTDDQTSVQWRSRPADVCPRFAEWAESGQVSALHASCPDLEASIVHAVRDGAISLSVHEFDESSADNA